MKRDATLILGLGSNKGDRLEQIQKAIDLLEKGFQTSIFSSSIYETESWGFQTEDSFLNCCVRLECKLVPQKVLEITQHIEQEIGRKEKTKGKRYQSRVIDIDILYYGNCIISSRELVIPHPLIQERNFVLRPLLDICPHFIDPVKKRNIMTLSIQCNDINKVRLCKKC